MKNNNIKEDGSMKQRIADFVMRNKDKLAVCLLAFGIAASGFAVSSRKISTKEIFETRANIKAAIASEFGDIRTDLHEELEERIFDEYSIILRNEEIGTKKGDKPKRDNALKRATIDVIVEERHENDRIME